MDSLTQFLDYLKSVSSEHPGQAGALFTIIAIALWAISTQSPIWKGIACVLVFIALYVWWKTQRGPDYDRIVLEGERAARKKYEEGLATQGTNPVLAGECFEHALSKYKQVRLQRKDFPSIQVGIVRCVNELIKDEMIRAGRVVSFDDLIFADELCEKITKDCTPKLSKRKSGKAGNDETQKVAALLTEMAQCEERMITHLSTYHEQDYHAYMEVRKK